MRWLEGDVPTVVDPASRAASTRPALARDLAAVVTALHDIQVPDSALADPQLRWYRGAPLGSMDDTTRHNVAACRDISGLDLDLDAALRIWEEATALPETGPGSTPPGRFWTLPRARCSAVPSELTKRRGCGDGHGRSRWPS